MTYPVSSRKKGLTLTAKEGLSFAEVSMRFGLSKSSEIRNIHEGLPIKKPHYHPRATPTTVESCRRAEEKILIKKGMKARR